MALDHLIRIAAEHFGIQKPDDWCAIRPEWIRQLDGCGPATVDHLRIYLAARGLTLRNDATPEYWQRNLSAARIGGQVSKSDQAITNPFTILIDVQEKQPFTFQGMLADAAENRRPLLVPTKYHSLGPSHGDYSIEGFERCVHIERKSMADAHGTFLSHGDRRDRWEATLEFLASIQCAAVVVECTIGQLIANVEARGKRSKGTLAKTIHRQVIAWAEDYRIPFHFCDDRRLAEITTFSILRRFYRHETQPKQEPGGQLDAVVADL